MKARDFILVTAAIILGATIANLIALKIAAGQVQGSLQSSSLLGLLLGKQTATTG